MPKKKINVTIIDSLTPDTGGPNRQLARRGAGQADTKLESDIPLGLHGEELVRYSLQQTAKASVHFAKSTNEGRGYRHGKSSPRKSTLASINSAQSKRASSRSSKGHGQANRKTALSQLPAIKHLDTKRSKGPSIVSNRAGGFLWTDNSDDSLPDEPGFYASSFSGHLKHLPLSVAKRLQLEALHPMFASDTSLTSLLPAPETVRLDDMSAKSMARLEYVFKIAEEEEGPLCFDTFKKVLQAVLGHRVSERELMMMFMKIDSNCDEVISWSEYVSFLLCELQKKDEMQSTKNDNPLPDDISSVVLSRHHNFIIRIKFTPTLLNRGTRNERWDMATGRYISLSQDGTVCFWRQNMECLRVHNLEMNRATSIYFTDIAAMSNVNCIVVSTSQSDLRFYELSGHKRFDRIMTLTHMKHMVLCMDYWFDKQDMNKAKLFWGDAAGNIYILTFWRCLSGALFGNVSEENRLPLKQFVLDIQFGLKNRYTLQKVKRLHLDWVRAVQYIPDLEAIDLKSKHFVVTKGAVCFDYSTRQNILICGGVEQNIRGWNPFINTGPIFRLKGTSAVMHLMVNNERDLCISISRDNNVSVFSLKDQTLVQMIPARSFPKQIGHKTISSAIFNNHSQVLVVGTTDLNLFVPDLEGEDTKRSNTHESSICSVLYNPIYDLVVSSSNGASVCVWDIKTGEKKLMFDRAHVTTIYNKEMVVDITAMSFDHTYRRLITGGRDGSVKIWNFHNGDCLRMVKVAEHSEKIICSVVMSSVCNSSYDGVDFKLRDLAQECRLHSNASDFFHDHILPCYENRSRYFDISAAMPQYEKWSSGHDWKKMGSSANVYCKLDCFTRVTSRTLGQASIVIIAISRLIAIRWPLAVSKLRMNSKSLNFLRVVFIWILVTCTGTPSIVYCNTDNVFLKPNRTLLRENSSFLRPMYREMTNNDDSCAAYTKICFASTKNGDRLHLASIVWWTELVFNMVIPQIVVFLTYSLIIYTLVQRRRKRSATFGANATFRSQTNKITGIVSMPYKILVTGLNRRVVTFMDAAGTESMNKVWDKKHQEDILAMCYHHPNILITASYDGDLIVWSTETNQAACRLNCTESTKPMMGIDKPKKVDSQRTLIAKKYDLARKAIYPEVEAEAGKLHFLDLVNAQSLASEYESWLIANQQRASNQDSQAPSSATGWMKKPPAEIRASTDTSSYETIVLQGLKNLSARQSMTSQNSNDNMLRCEECRGFLPGVEENENQQLEAHQMCKCAEHQEVEQPAHLRFNSAPSNPADRTHLQNLLKKLSAISEADNESYKSNHQRHSNLQSARGSTGSRGRSSGGKFRLKYSDDRQLSIKENIWLLRNSSLRDRRREADKLTMSPSSSVINAAIKGPQQMITSNSIECLVSLDRRKVDKKTAVVFAGGLDGWIRAWSIHYRSGLLGQFRGSHRPQDAVTCMTTDAKNLYLFSADSRGYIKVWFIGDYCIKTPYTTTLSAEEYFAFKSDRNKKYQQFASSKFFDQFTRRESRAGIDSINPTPEASDPTRTVKRPVLLCSFRGHLKAITSIMYADNYQLIFTGSEDNNVRVWTINGRFVGQLGTHEWPHLKEDNPDWFEEVTDFQLPQDIRRVASPRTLRVLYGGVSKKWKLVKNGIMMLIGPWFRLGLRVPTKAITKPGRNTRNATPTSTPAESENKLNIKVPFSLTRMELDSEEDLSVPTMTHPVNVETSSILGKAYRKITNHRPPPRNIKFETIEDTVKVWPKVKTTNMEDIKVAADYPVPDVLVARNNRRDKYIQQIIKTKAARRLLHEEYGDKSLIGEPSESDIPANRTLVITNSAVVSKSPLVTTQRKRNPFIPAEKIAKTKMKPSKHHDDTETFTIDKLSLEICEIMGEANEDPTDLDQSSV